MAWAWNAIGSFVAEAAPAAAQTAGETTSIWTVATDVLVNLAISQAMTALQPKVGSAGRTFEWTLDPNAPIPFAAGRVGVAGTICHLATYGRDKMYYGFVSVLSGAGPIKSVLKFMGDQEEVEFDEHGSAQSSQWKNEMWFRYKLGTQPDTALSFDMGLKDGAMFPDWGEGHKLSGKACYGLVLGENSKRTAYPTGEPKPLLTLEGLFGWDPRQDSTYPGGFGPCRLNNPATWVWLENPILWGLKWALGLWESPVGKGAPFVGYQVGGIGATIDGIDVPAFVAAANIADMNGWKVAAYPTTDDDKAQVLDAFLQAGGAKYAKRAGKISCLQRAAPRVSVATITAADTAGPLEIDTAASRLSRINTIRPKFWDEGSRWQMAPIDEVTSAAYRAEDRGVRPRGIDYPYVRIAKQAAELAALDIANSREPIAGTIPLKAHMRNLAPGMAFTINEPGFLLHGVKMLCLNTEYDPASAVVTVTFVTETDAKYPFALGQSPTAPTPPVLTPFDPTVSPPAPGEWTLTSEMLTDNGASIPALVLTGSVENARAQSVIFEFQPVDPDNPTAPWADLWSGAGTEDPTVERKEITGLTPTPYWGAVSYRVGGNISARLVLGPVTAGSLLPPPAPAPGTVAGVPVLSIATTLQPDGTEVSLLSGTWAVPTGATSYDIEIDDGLTTWIDSRGTAAIKALRVVSGRTYRYRVKASNRDGVRSAAWSSWSASVIASGDQTAPGLIIAGTITPLARRIILTWTNPADADLSHLRMYRNLTGVAPTAGDLFAPRITGSVWTDVGVSAGIRYFYWAEPVDRTGNVGALVFLGSDIPTYVSTGGGDVSPTDPTLVTQYGTAALIAGQGALAVQNTVTALQVPYANIANSFGDEDFNTTLITPSAGAVIDTTAETTGTLGVIRSIKSPVGAGKAAGAQDQFTTFGSSAQYVGVTPGGRFRFTGRAMVKAGFTGLLRQLLYFVGPTGATVGGPTVLTYVDCRAVAQPATAVVDMDQQVTVPSGAVKAYFVYLLDWSSSLANAAYVLVAKPGMRFVTDFGALTPDAVRLGSNVRQSNGITPVTDATAITSMGTAALLQGQTRYATQAVNDYASNAAALAAGQIGRVFYNTTSGRMETCLNPQVNSSTVKVFHSGAGGATATSSVYASVGDVFLELDASLDGGSLNADASWVGEIKLEETDGATTRVIGTVPLVVNSSGLDLGGGVYASDGGNARITGTGIKTGNLTYRAAITRTGGADFVAGAVLNCVLKITPQS